VGGVETKISFGATSHGIDARQNSFFTLLSVAIRAAFGQERKKKRLEART
jgi:hypothetical protein